MNQLLVNLIAGFSLLFSILFFLNPNQCNNKGNRWLSLFVFSIFLMNIDEFLYYNNLKCEFVKFYVFSRYCIVPLFYFTIVYYVNPSKKWFSVYYLHFIFGFLFVVFEQNSTYIINGNLVINNSTSTNFHIYFNQFLMYFVLPLQIIFYLIHCFIEIDKHEKNIKNFSSNTDKIDLKWLKHILYIIISFSAFFIIYIFNQSAIMINSVLLISLLFIGYNALKQQEIYAFSDNKQQEIIAIIHKKNIDCSEKKKLISNEKLKETQESLINIMCSQKPFLNSELSLILLANQMDVSPHLLSYVINEGFNENFNQFVNRYRIEEAKKIILDPKMDYLSILGITFEVGFNSKSVFNATFKKITGQTPIAFKKEKISS